MSLGCARCGSCCEAIRVNFDPRNKPGEVAKFDGGEWDPRTEAGMAGWLARHPEYAACPEAAFAIWTLLLADARFYAEHWHVLWTEDDRRSVTHVIECDAYDPATRSCTRHDERPLACRYYPWYDEGPFESRTPPRRLARNLQHDGKVAPGVGCSYLLDVPAEDREGLRPLIPLAVI